MATALRFDLPQSRLHPVFNKLDLLDEEEATRRIDTVVEALAWDGPAFRISAVTGMGTEALCQAVMNELEALADTMDEAGEGDAANEAAAADEDVRRR